MMHLLFYFLMKVVYAYYLMVLQNSFNQISILSKHTSTIIIEYGLEIVFISKSVVLPQNR